MWSVETCSDWFAVQLLRIHFSGWYHLFCARGAILQLQNNSNEVVKINCISSPTSWPYVAEFPSAARFELQETLEFLSDANTALLSCAGHNQSCLLTVWSKEVLGLRWLQSTAVFFHGMFHNVSVFAWANPSEIHPVLAARWQCCAFWSSNGVSDQQLMPHFSFQLSLFCYELYLDIQFWQVLHEIFLRIEMSF